jgi:divinyl chlorophyllide a 8-vinyl-reductase
MTGALDVPATPSTSSTQRVLLLGATGTIGRATARALLARGHRVTCVVRPRSGAGGCWQPGDVERELAGVTVRVADVGVAASLARDGLAGERFDAVVSCMASRTGVPRDAWRVDHDAHQVVLRVAADAGVRHFVLLSALCVQKPRLAFQQAKLAFEQTLMASGLRHSIVRPTAFFKSLVGQVGRVRQGKPYLLFGDGRLTACKPISDRDLADFLAGCLDEPDRWNRVLPIGGPGPAISPREQGEALFRQLGLPARFRSVPPGFLRGVAALLGGLGRVVPGLADKAELARIGHYYATESMLWFDPTTGRYDAERTPSHGADRFLDFQAEVAAGRAQVDRGDHTIF